MNVLQIRRIGVVDSGVGGLVVAQQIVQQPGVVVYYCADYEHVPYGSKSFHDIKQYGLRLVQKAVACGVDVVVIACHTICTVAYEYICAQIPDTVMVPLWQTIAYPLASLPESRVVYIMATPATIRTAYYQRALKKLRPDITVIAQACDLLAWRIEQYITKEKKYDRALRHLVMRYLEPAITAEADTIILGCTHYAYIHDMINACMPYPVTIISAEKYIVPVLQQYATVGMAHQPSCMRRVD